MSSEKVTADFYIVLEPRRAYWDPKKIVSIVATALRQGKPAIPKGHVAVHLKLRFDKGALEESIPAIEFDVPTFATAEPEAEVAA